jgi:hypothetical protein
MDISKVLDQLKKELQHLDAAIVSLERLQQKGLRRERPGKSKPRGSANRAKGFRRQSYGENIN